MCVRDLSRYTTGFVQWQTRDGKVMHAIDIKCFYGEEVC